MGRSRETGCDQSSAAGARSAAALRRHVRMTKEEFDRFLDTPRNLLTGLDKQRQFLLHMALRKSECIHPDCNQTLNQLDACEQGFDGYQLGSSSANTYS